MREILKISEALFSGWNRSNVNYCHWKSNEHLYEGLIGDTDLDVLVDVNDKAKAEKCLINLKYIKLVSQYGSRYQFVDDWVSCDADTGKLVHIHLHYKMITGHKGLKEYDLPWTELALDTRIKDEEFPVYIVDPNLEIIILLTRLGLKANYIKEFKALLGRYHISADTLAEIKYLKDKIDIKKTETIAQQYMGSNTQRFMYLLMDDKYDVTWFTRLRRLTKKQFKKYNRLPFLIEPLYRVFYYITIYARIYIKKKHWNNPITRKTVNEGVIIAFIGQDGAGKSTVTDEVYKWLTWKIDATKYYLGSGEHYFSWQKTLRAKMKKNSVVYRIFGNLLTVSNLKEIAKRTNKSICLAKMYAVKGGIAILDRYPQLSFEGINDGPKIRCNSKNKKLSKIARMYISRSAAIEEKYLQKAVEIQPDLVFKMILPPEESIRRKPEESLENVQRKHEIIKQLEFNNARVITIDATQDLREELRCIHNEIWSILLEREYGKTD